jgi:hypothetical protein
MFSIPGDDRTQAVRVVLMPFGKEFNDYQNANIVDGEFPEFTKLRIRSGQRPYSTYPDFVSLQ